MAQFFNIWNGALAMTLPLALAIIGESKVSIERIEVKHTKSFTYSVIYNTVKTFSLPLELNLVLKYVQYRLYHQNNFDLRL